MDAIRKERIKRELKKAGLFSEFDNDIFGDANGQCKVIVIIYEDRVVFRHQWKFLQTVRTTTDEEFNYECQRVKNVLSKTVSEDFALQMLSVALHKQKVC